MRTPRHDYGPTATPAKYATPRADPLGSSINAGNLNTPGTGFAPASHTFDFLQHPLFSEPEALQGGLQFEDLYSQMAAFKESMDLFVEEGCSRVDEAKENHALLKEDHRTKLKALEKETEGEKKTQKDLFAGEFRLPVPSSLYA